MRPSVGRYVFSGNGTSSVIYSSVQWGIVFISALVFLVCVEVWKFGKRVHFHRKMRGVDVA